MASNPDRTDRDPGRRDRVESRPGRRDREPGEDNLAARTDVDKSGVERPAGAAVTGPHGVEAPAVTGHDVPARDENAVPPPEAGEDSTEQNLDRRATREDRDRR